MTEKIVELTNCENKSLIELPFQISVVAPEFNFWYLQLGLKENMSKYKER
jgi:hypothetical protein